MSNVAASVRRRKEEHPSHYCHRRECLWRVVKGDGSISACPKHPICQDCRDPSRATGLYVEDGEKVRLCGRCATIALNVGDDVTPILTESAT